MSFSFLNNTTFLKYSSGFLGSVFLVRYFFNGPKTYAKRDMNGKIALVTGCSAGIGKETAKDLLNKGAKVVFACRDKTKTLNVINQITNESNRNNAIFMQLNLTSFNSVAAFVDEFSKKFDKLDLLINNAGLFNDKFILTENNLENTLQTNHISHFALTGMLLKFLKKSDDPRIINVSSRAHYSTDNTLDVLPISEKTYKTISIYAISKAANIYFSEALKQYSESRSDEISKIKAVSLHPGAVLTELYHTEGRSALFKALIWIFYPVIKMFFKDELMGAQTTLHCAYIDKSKLVNGGYYSNCCETTTSSVIRKYDLEKKIHKMSYEAVSAHKVFEQYQNDKDFVEYMNFFKTKF